MPPGAGDSETFVRRCMKFYRDKTLERVEQFYRTCKRTDGTQPINGVPMPTLASLLEQVDWQALSHGVAGRWHGDFHFENILWDEPSTFTFWTGARISAGDLGAGDISTSPLLHGLIVNHKVIARESVHHRLVGYAVGYDMMRPQTLVECERLFGAWISQGLTGAACPAHRADLPEHRRAASPSLHPVPVRWAGPAHADRWSPE